MRRALVRLPPRASPSPFGGGDSSYMVEDTVSKDLASKLRQQFYDVGQKKCNLCDEFYQVSSYQGHSCYAWHQARVGIIERLISGTAENAVHAPKRWWDSIAKNKTCHFDRLPALSHETQNGRLQRVFYLLAFLVQRGVIRESLTIYQNNIIHRSTEFEKFEMVGDNVIKFVFADRLSLLFPASEGGLNNRLSLIQQLIDSNEGLLRCYDYLHLDWIIGCKLPNSKTKSDVIESLFGELQTWLWADEVRWGMEYYDYLPCLEHRSLRALVAHTLNELTHLLVMFAVLTTHQRSIDFVLKNLRTNHIRSSNQRTNEKDKSSRPRYSVPPYIEQTSLPVSASGGSHVNVQKKIYELLKQPRARSELYTSRYRVTCRFVSSMGRYEEKLAAACDLVKDVIPAERQRAMVEQLVSLTYVPADWEAKLQTLASAFGDSSTPTCEPELMPTCDRVERSRGSVKHSFVSGAYALDSSPSR